MLWCCLSPHQVGHLSHELSQVELYRADVAAERVLVVVPDPKIEDQDVGRDSPNIGKVGEDVLCQMNPIIPERALQHWIADLITHARAHFCMCTTATPLRSKVASNGAVPV